MNPELGEVVSFLNKSEQEIAKRGLKLIKIGAISDAFD